MTDWNKKFESYVKHSYLYYEAYDPVISDYEFDMLCKSLHDNWDKVDHPDKALTDEEALAAGTGYQMAFKYPEWAKA